MKTFSLLFIAFLFLQFASLAQQGWLAQNSGISDPYHSLYSVFFSNGNIGWAAGGYSTGDTRHGVITHTTNGGLSWDEQAIPVSCQITSVCFVNESIGWASTGRDGNIGTAYVLKTTDSGVNWTIVNQDLMGTFYDIFFIDGNTGWTVTGNIEKTTDGGTTWTSQYGGTDTTFEAIHFFNQNIGWAAGGYASGGFSNGLVAHTTNGGLNWEDQTLNPTYPVSFLNGVQFIDENIGWTAGHKSDSLGGFHVPVLYKTMDGGSNWIEKSLPITEPGELKALHFADANNGWVVGSFGSIVWEGSLILQTTNGGENWVEQEHSEINSLLGVYFIDSNEGWAVGNGCTILHTTNGGVSFVEEEQIDEIPTDYSLTQNFPNPFNPSTKIRYSVPQLSKVVIKVFDILGNEIETLVNEEKLTGTYELTWNAINLPSGIYFYQLRVGSFVDTKKMLLLK